MNYLENKSEQNWKPSNRKSICRLVALNQDIAYCSIKEQQIDQIRKKLLRMHKSKDREISNPDSQNQLANKIKDDHLVTIIQKERKYNKSKQPLPLIKQNQTCTQIRYKQKKAEQQQALHRKVKTEFQECCHNKENQTRKHYTNKFRIKKDNNLHFVDMSDCLHVKTENMLNHKKFWNRFAINEKLQPLRLNTKQTSFYNNAIQQNQNQNQAQVQLSTQRSQNIQKVLSYSEKQNHNKSNTVFSNLILKKQIASSKSQMIKLNFQKPKLKSNYQQKKKPSNAIVLQNYKCFPKFIGFTNGIILQNYGAHKFYVMKGNNDELIKRLMKKRKWIQTSNIQEANLVWSQKREQEFMRLLAKPSLNNIKNRNKRGIYGHQCQCQRNHQAGEECKFKKLVLLEGKQQQQKPNQFNFQYKFDKKLSKISFKADDLYKIQQKQGDKIRIHNHLKFNQQIAYKKLLFQNLKQYYEKNRVDPFQFIPLTFHIQSLAGEQWRTFAKLCEQRAHQKCLWIIKPGQNTNRGTGIKVQTQISRINELVSQILNKNTEKKSSVIIQQYVMPLLYNRRKFDIRCYVLVTIVRNKFKAYWYEEGYARTSCKLFSTDNVGNRYIHLTNDAVQKFSADYGKYESGNKLSFEALGKYIQNNCPSTNFKRDIYPNMVSLARDAIESTHHKMHEFGKDFVFEIFGLDFMIDDQCKTWLIQVNRNPCLETSTSLLARLIGEMMENALRIAVDPILPMPDEVFQSLNKKDKDPFTENKFRIIFQRQLQQNRPGNTQQQQNSCSESQLED